jgi:hypothetical protein
MNVQFNVTGSKRKALVGVISAISGHEIAYTGAPTFAYTVNHYLIDKDGNLSYPDDADHDEVKSLLAALKERGYDPRTDQNQDLDTANKLNIQIPTDDFTEEAIENLKKIIASKESLIKKALDTDNLLIDIIDGRLNFQWFSLRGIDGEADAYTRFISALCYMAKTQKRITAKEKALENDKFAMRVFLIRLGFIGLEYKTARTILLKNLTGNSSFKSGQRPQKTVAPETTVEATVSNENGGEQL